MPDLRLCFLGDSFVNGTSDPTLMGWAGHLCRDLIRQGYEITYYNLGIRRETSLELAQRWQTEVSCRVNPRYDTRLIFSFGTNDTTLEQGQPRVDPQLSLQTAHQILSQAQRSYPVLMISPPPIADSEQQQRISHLVQGLGTLCQELQILFLDVYTPLVASPLWMEQIAQGDGAHPQAEAYALLAQQILAWSGWQDWVKGGR